MQKVELSVLRVVAMLMVLVCHCYGTYVFGAVNPHWQFGIQHSFSYQQFCTVLNSIDITTFVFVSGFLYGYLKFEYGKYANIGDFLTKKAKRLLVPYLFWFLFIVIFIPGRGTIKDICFSVDHLWFLLMLMWCFLAISLTAKKWVKLPLAVSLLICVGIMGLYFVLPHFGIVPTIFCLDTFLVYFPFFFVGVLVAKFKVVEWLQQKFPYWIYLSLFVVSFAALIVAANPLGRFHSDLLARLAGFSVAFFAFVVMSIRQDWTCKLASPLLTSLDKNSMGIYILHSMLVVTVMQMGMADIMNEHHIIAPIILSIGVFAVSYALAAIINKTKFKVLFG